MTIKAIVFDAYGTLYDVHAVAVAIEAAFPGHGETITQIWRLKQLEYSWLRSLMGRYEDFRSVTRASLRYSLQVIGLEAGPGVLDELVDAYNTLPLYPEAGEALGRLGDYRLAILSNGTADMLEALVRHSGMDRMLETVISVDAKRAYKPDPRAYELVQERLGLRPAEVVFVSSNGFDVAGAKSFGLTVARIERVTQTALRQEIGGGAPIGPAAMYRALRTQTEALGFEADAVVESLLALPSFVRSLG